MPFPLALPITSQLSLVNHVQCISHPSLPFNATTARANVRSALKRYEQLPGPQQSINLGSITEATRSYIPLLLALQAGLTAHGIVAGEKIDVVLLHEVEVTWRATLTKTSFQGLKGGKIKLRGLDNEIAYIFWTMGNVEYLQSTLRLRNVLQNGFARQESVSEEHRKSQVSMAMKHLLDAHSIYSHLLNLLMKNAVRHSSEGVSPAIVSALDSLAMAEASLLAVYKEDPYILVAASFRDKQNNDWMIGAPKIPKVRAHLFARICFAAEEHVSRGIVQIESQTWGPRSTTSVGDVGQLLKYLRALEHVAKAKACRFLALDAEAGGSTAEAVGWLQAALDQLIPHDASSKNERTKTGFSNKGFASKLKRDWKQRREDRHIENGLDWGVDAGTLEESTIIEMLLGKWEKLNNTVNIQVVPSVKQLLSTVPSGRDCHSAKAFSVPSLDEHTLASMREPPSSEEVRRIRSEKGAEDSFDEDVDNTQQTLGDTRTSESQYF